MKKKTNSYSDLYPWTWFDWLAFDLVALACLVCGGWRGGIVFVIFFLFIKLLEKIDCV